MDSGGGKIEYDSADPAAQDAFGSAVEIHQNAGDVLLFVRSQLHPPRLYAHSQTSRLRHTNLDPITRVADDDRSTAACTDLRLVKL